MVQSRNDKADSLRVTKRLVVKAIQTDEAFQRESMIFSICLFRLLSKTMFTQEWDKFKVAFVLQGKPHFVEEDDKVINTKVRSACAACN